MGAAKSASFSTFARRNLQILNMANLILDVEAQTVTVEDPSPTVSVLWDRALQEAVIEAAPGPTVASRAYGMMHAAMFDAWAQYDPAAIATTIGDRLQVPAAENTIANKTEAMSFAAYVVANDLFPEARDSFDALMNELGFDPTDAIADASTPAGIGTIVAGELLELRQQDGSNQLGDDPNGTGTPYSDTTAYEPINPTPETITDIAAWTPERIPIDDADGPLQSFLTPQWGDVLPFALSSGSEFRPPAPEPFLLVEGATTDLEAGTIALADGTVVEIAPELVGTIINPDFIAQAEEVIAFSANLSDRDKLIAEFWEDGGGTSFPPGTWMTFGQFVSARDENTLDDDAKLFFALGNAVFDAGIATWEAKRFYDYVRPVRAIRTLGELGLVGEFDPDLGGFAIVAYVQGEGTQTILATDFETYQEPGREASPPFAEYTSGHSAFSRAAAAVLQAYTGSDRFGASVTFPAGSARFEPGLTPANETTLSWETFLDAADEAGLSRLYGGIHFTEGDLFGRELGARVGAAVFAEAQTYIEGGRQPQLVFGSLGDDIGTAAVELANDNLVRPTLAFAGGGDDLIDAAVGNSVAPDRLYGGSGNDELIAGTGDRVFGGDGNDILDATAGGGGNRLYGGNGNDTLFVGSGDRALGGAGADEIFVTSGGGNTLSGGAGADIFSIANAEIPPEATTITDFNSGEDILAIGGLGITFNDLTIASSTNTSVALNGSELAILLGVTELTAADFEFS
ncbi:PAP2 superfamily/hemolysin-type calcium-binding repeat (2 copies) [Rubidibacter lacunae KORDI 51-2]|uniref:PAP2 superfamily/hemolysin-type calcium-binding repeat (2 copies) n=1 Tax=Rubidibacter lacunae KORDI 51-2 TaxID=582515 RepID=U5DN85_9CHRO|nr:phosphatase PAP2 family protein [Rubidibacter lacunae]ERN42327.1 PAP2 superfamily/hemolysin-type calcium-binding repeat (2 copies) [Rubidibacter lacunae KORDI 51-2]